MNNRIRLFLLIIVMTTVSGFVVGINTYLLYQTTLEQQQQRLQAIAQSRARFIEATWETKKDQTAVFNILLKTQHTLPEIGKTGELTVGKRQEDRIIFLLSHQHQPSNQPYGISWNGSRGEAMRRALLGQSGTLIGLDYEGNQVLAAYEPISDLSWGVVAKIDLQEIQAPLIPTTSYTILITMIINVLGAIVLYKLNLPLIQKLEAAKLELSHLNQILKTRRKCSQIVISAVNEAQFLQDICNLIITIGGYHFAWVAWFKEPGKICMIAESPNLDHQDIHLNGGVPEILLHTDSTPNPINTVLQTRQPLLFCQNAITDNDSSNFLTWQEEILQIQCPAAIALPLIFAEEPLGVLNIYDTNPQAFDPETIELLTELADDVAYGIKTLRTRFAHEQAEVELQQLTEELENRVQERTQQLSQLNQELLWEVAERKQAEIALRKSEERFRTLADFTYDWEYWIDPQGNFVYISPSCERITGYSVEEFTQNPKLVEQIIHPDDQTWLETHHCQDVTPLKTALIHFRIITRQQETRWISHVCQPVYNSQGYCLGQRVSNRDITEQKQAEAAVRESEERFRRMADTAPVLIWMSGTDTLCHFFNKPWLDFTGRTLAEESGNGWTEGVHPDDLQHCANTYVSAFKARQAFKMEYRLRRADGEYRWLLDSGRPLYDADGIFAGYIGSCIDIHDRKDAEEALRESQHFIQRIADASPSILYLYDLQTQHLIYINREVTTILGYHPNEMKAMTQEVLQTLIHPDDWSMMEQHYQTFRYRHNGDILEIEYRMKSQKGVWRWLVSRHTVFTHTPQGQPQQILGTATDITEQKQTQAILEQTNIKLRSWVSQLEERNHDMELLSELSDSLQSCLTIEEAYHILADLLRPLFPEGAGVVYTLNGSGNLVEAIAHWGSSHGSEMLFSPEQCWALRRGRLCYNEESFPGLFCQHIHKTAVPPAALCAPMIAQGETIGLLYVSFSESGSLNQSKKQLARTVAEHLSLALANLKLRETLRYQSIRDPLTGLFNRRYMQESLERELYRAQRGNQTLGVIMLDIDHFKQFNDTFGHDAGDLVLQALGQFLQHNIRGSDIACRYGGEELLLILPEVTLEILQRRAEEIRQAVTDLKVKRQSQLLGMITVSVGIALFPQHGGTSDQLIKAADTALYEAKKQGRNRVVLA